MIIDPSALTPGAMYRFTISAIVPRPIAFVSTVSAEGRTNVAPFSYFAPITERPPLLGVSIGRRRGGIKDTTRNIREVGDFVVNIVNAPLFRRMVYASGDWPPEESEFDLTGLTPVTSERVKSPRVGESPISFECRLHREIELGDSFLTVGEIQLVHVADGLIEDGRVDPLKLGAIGRLGGDGYTIVDDVVRERRPDVVKRDP